jgi:hypothetical protein
VVSTTYFVNYISLVTNRFEGLINRREKLPRREWHMLITYSFGNAQPRASIPSGRNVSHSRHPLSLKKSPACLTLPRRRNHSYTRAPILCPVASLYQHIRAPSCVAQCCPIPLHFAIAAIHRHAPIRAHPLRPRCAPRLHHPGAIRRRSSPAWTTSPAVGRRHHNKRTHMLQMHVSSVSDVAEVCCKCFI